METEDLENKRDGLSLGWDRIVSPDLLGSTGGEEDLLVASSFSTPLPTSFFSILPSGTSRTSGKSRLMWERLERGCDCQWKKSYFPDIWSSFSQTMSSPSKAIPPRIEPGFQEWWGGIGNSCVGRENIHYVISVVFSWTQIAYEGFVAFPLLRLYL